ncbi:MAG: DUF742 domain-containing protein [Acidimicrobiia bacterium]
MTVIDDDIDVASDVVDEHDEDVGDETGRLVRPYAMTGGRTGTDVEISLEAQIQASTRASHHLGAYRWEAAKLIEIVETPMALIEISARLEIPIGVARVLVADLVEDGAVVVHVPQKTQNYTSLLERVLDGVRNL